MIKLLSGLFFCSSSASAAASASPSDYISSLPQELIFEIFSYLKLSGLGAMANTCRLYRALLSIDTEGKSDQEVEGSDLKNRFRELTLKIWKEAIYKEIAISDKNWAEWFGRDVVKGETPGEDFRSLPVKEVIQAFRGIKKVFPEKLARESLLLVRMPKTLNGGLTINRFGELLKQRFPRNVYGYRVIWVRIVQVIGDKPIEKSCWVLMTTDVLPGSRNKRYREQKDLVREVAREALVGFEIPEALDAITCILAEYFKTGKRLCGDSPSTYARCQENVQGYQLDVGGFASAGLEVSYGDYDYDFIGALALKKF